jgi:ATP-dependent exoDNAse (exonuclease V) beta subunit
VVIADAAYQPPAWSDPVLLDDRIGLLVGLRDSNGARPIAYKLGDLAETERDEAEDKRLLYVAATRAKEKLLVNGHVKRLKAGNLSLGGWLSDLGKVTGLNEVKLTGDIGVPQILELNPPSDAGALTCSLYPLPSNIRTPNSLTPSALPPTTPHPPTEQETIPAKPSGGRALPDLAAPLRVPEERLLDEKILAREADPPQRVWRIVPRAKRPTGPAWVVGKLVHEAIRYWRFPDDDFEAFITPFALESGLTDQAETRATIRTVERLLTLFRAHPLWAEIDAAERYHEVPYAIPGDRGIIDLLYRTEAGWVITDFKTDELRSEAEVADTIQRHGYDWQVQRYAKAVAAQLGAHPKLLLVFLQVGRDKISLVEIS